MSSHYVRQGHSYMGGASKPFFITQGMLVQAAIDKGFDQVKVISRSQYPTASLPPLPSGTDDGWDTIGMGHRTAPDGAEELPGAVKWVVDVTQAEAPTGPAPTPVDPGTGQPTDPGGPAPGSGQVTWLPPVYPEMVPQDLPWTTTPSSVWTEVFLAVAIGAAGFVLYEALRG